jgi:hypothetical protein
MRHLTLAALGLTLSLGSLASARAEPAPASPEATLVEGLTLLRDGKFDPWIAKLCSKAKLCINDNAVASLKRYNLPAKQRRAAACLRDNGAAVEVNRTDDLSATERKIFLNCEPTAMPVPFHLVKEGEAWRFSQI